VTDYCTWREKGSAAFPSEGRRHQGNAPDDPASVGLERVTLQAGTVYVPLRSSQERGVVGPMQCKELPGSGKIAVTLYVAESVQFPEHR
jgi:hypothetical protein